MGGQQSISKFENSLTDYMVSMQSNQFEDVQSYSYKYNNLKFYMDPERVKEPHFFVQLGISEACFNIERAAKLDGSLGPEDRMVQKWASRYNIHSELEAHWKMLMQQKEEGGKTIDLKTPEDITEEENARIAVDMTSTGISKSKRLIAAQRRKKGFMKFKKEKILND
ncbi:hypothetical protein IJ579_02015 [bacterium]|nr:hypothetical protein [bacterium]